MEQNAESQAAADIIAGADTHSTSSNGFGPEAAPSAAPSPIVLVAAALAGGFLLARILRRMRG
jgi:hypothetical protein